MRLALQMKDWITMNLIYSIVQKICRLWRANRYRELIRNSGLFDTDWYLVQNPDVAQSQMDPALHYLIYGGFEGRDPGPKFSSAFYLENYPDVKSSGINPLLHYLLHGTKKIYPTTLSLPCMFSTRREL